MRKLFVIPLLVVGVCGLIIGGCAETSAAEKIFKWRAQISCPETDQDYYINFEGLKRLIEEGSGGRVQVTLYPVGVLCGPDDIVNTVAQGAIEAGFIIAGMAGNRAPSTVGTEMPYGAMDLEQHYEVHYKAGLLDIMREELATHNLYLLSATSCGPLVFFSSTPVNTTDDFKGMKIWAPPSCEWLSDFGASLTEVPGWDMYMGMKLGTLDGLTWTVAELEGANFKEVVPYVIMPQLLVAGGQFIVNMKAWNALGPDLQRQIQDYVNANVFNLYEKIKANCDAAVAAAKAYGVQFTTLDQSELAKMEKASKPFWDKMAAGSPHAARMVETYRNYLKSVDK